MNSEIIEKLNLKKANFCLKPPYQDLIAYYYKKDVYIASTGFNDGISNINIIYRSEKEEYSAMPDDYLLAVPMGDIDKGLKLD